MSQIIEYIKEKKILILGYGREGISTYNYIRKHLPEKKITIADKNYVKIDDKNVDLICGDDYLSYLGDFDIVFKSPGIAFLDDVSNIPPPEVVIILLPLKLTTLYLPKVPHCLPLQVAESASAASSIIIALCFSATSVSDKKQREKAPEKEVVSGKAIVVEVCQV